MRLLGLVARQAEAYWGVDSERLGERREGMETKLIRCCKCKDYKWNTPEDIIYTDAKGREYCLFHAPMDEKKCGNDDPMTVELFNHRLFEYIRDRHDRSNNTTCNISGTIFPGDISFCKRYGDSGLFPVQLQYAVFTGDVSFSGLLIVEANFSNAIFEGSADFNNVLFESDQTFFKTTFCRRVDFSKAIFEKSSLFTGATFASSVWFTESIFSEDIILQAITANDQLIMVRKISKQSLSKIRLNSFEVNKFCFTECNEWPDNFGFENERETSIQYMEELYRAMKQQALEQQDQQQASHWHFCEKEMYKQQRWYRRWQPFHLAWLYWAFSGYGEKPLRAGVWLVALLLLPFVMHSPIAAWLSSMLSSLWAAIPYSANVDTFAAAIRDSVNATAAVGFIPFMKETNGTSDGFRLGQALWQGVILLQFSLFALAVRNRFRR